MKIASPSLKWPPAAWEKPASNSRAPAALWKRLVAFDHCRVLLPHFTFARQPDAVAELQRLALADRHPQAAGLWHRFAARALYAAVVVRQMVPCFRRHAAYVASRDGIDRWRQWRDLWHSSWRHNRHPRHYYWRKLYRTPDRSGWLDNLEHRQLMVLLHRINDHLPVEPALDKVAFHEHCISHRLPTPTILAAWDERGRPTFEAARPPGGDVFVKPATDFGSTGIVTVPHDPATGRYAFAGRELAWPGLLARLGRVALESRQPLVLQPRLRNARRAALYGDFDLCNLRLVTGRPPEGKPEALGAFIRLPSKLTTTGHDRRVLFAIVDIDSGRQGAGRFRDITLGEYPFHPETSARIAGRVIPGWNDMVQLALHAHATLPCIPFIGWDIVDTTDGVLLLEANAYWGADALQAPGGVPLGRTRFPAIYLEWFDRLGRPSAKT